MRIGRREFLTLLFTAPFWAGCGSKGLQKPNLEVSVTAFRPLAGEGMVPKFEIDLHLVNTSAVNIDLRGVVYRVYLKGKKVLTGAANDLPKIPAYGEADVAVTATPDLFASLGFFRELLTTGSSEVEYRVEVDVDAGSWLPVIRTRREGTISLLPKHTR